MSATLTMYGRGQMLQAVFQPDLYVAPAGLWVAYTTMPPIANADGSLLEEPVSGYGRAPYHPFNSAWWGFTGFAEMYNLAQIVFPAPTANWGLINGWALVDSATIGAGNCWAVGTHSEPYVVDAGDPAPVVDVGGIAVGLYD